MSVCNHDCALTSNIKNPVSGYSNALENQLPHPCRICHILTGRSGYPTAEKGCPFLRNSVQNRRPNSDIKAYSSDEYEQAATTSASISNEFAFPKDSHINPTGKTLLPLHEFRFHKQPTGLEIYLKRLYESRSSDENCSDLNKRSFTKKENTGTQGKKSAFLETRKCRCYEDSSEESQQSYCAPYCGKQENEKSRESDSSTKQESGEESSISGCICTGAVESMVKYPTYTLSFKCCDLPGHKPRDCCCRLLRPLELSLSKPQGWEWSNVHARPDILLRAFSPFSTLPPVWTRKTISKPTCIMRPMVVRNWDPLLYTD